MAKRGPVVVDPQGFRLTILSIGKLGLSAAVAGRAALQAAGAVLLDRTRRNTALKDHSLRRLARLDHPYARRHGKIQVHQDRPWLVHKRSGAFQAAMRGRLLSSPLGYDVYAADTAPHVRKVILGTKVMLPRDVIWYTAHERATKVAMMRAVVTILGRGLRAKAAVRFD